MNEQLDKFIEFFERQDKKACVFLCLDWLASGTIGVVELYENILRAALGKMTCDINEKELCIWKEHVSTAIVRTILENAYPYVIREREKQKYECSTGKVLVLCPDGEYHEIGARMIADYFTLQGYDAIFVGSSTPREELLDAIRALDPDLIAVSVTNFYNLVAAKKLILEIHSKLKKKVPVIAGGQAFENRSDIAGELGADLLLRSYEDIKKAGSLIERDGDAL